MTAPRMTNSLCSRTMTVLRISAAILNSSEVASPLARSTLKLPCTGRRNTLTFRYTQKAETVLHVTTKMPISSRTGMMTDSSSSISVSSMSSLPLNFQPHLFGQFRKHQLVAAAAKFLHLCWRHRAVQPDGDPTARPVRENLHKPFFHLPVILFPAHARASAAATPSMSASGRAA